MINQDLKILIYLVVTIMIFILFKIWSLIWTKLVKWTKNTDTKFDNNNDDSEVLFENFYFTIHTMIYLGGLGLLIIFSWVEYLGLYTLVSLLISFILTTILFKKVNPKLTNIISSVDIIRYSSFVYYKKIAKREKYYYYINTLFTLTLICLAISVLIAYFGLDKTFFTH